MVLHASGQARLSWIHIVVYICSLFVILSNVSSHADLCGDSNIDCGSAGRCFNESCQCFEGYTGMGCQQEVKCTNLNYVLENTVLPQHKTSYGTLVMYKCAHEYQFTDALDQKTPVYKTTRCSAEGNWEPLSECIALCSPIAVWRGYMVDTYNRYAETVVKYRCYGVYSRFTDYKGHRQYKFKTGEEEIRIAECLTNGTWYPEIEPCIEIVPQANTGSTSSAVRITGLVVLASILLTY